MRLQENYEGEESSEEEEQPRIQNIWTGEDFYEDIEEVLVQGRESNEYFQAIDVYLAEQDRYVDDLSGTIVAAVPTEVTDESSDMLSDQRLLSLADICDEALVNSNQILRDVIQSGEFEDFQDEPEACDWYEDPFGEDFINDFSLIEDMWSPEKGWLRWAMVEDWDQLKEDQWIELLKNKMTDIETSMKPEEQMTDDEFSLHVNITDTIDLIKTPGRAKEGVQVLYDLLKGNDEVNLNHYISDLDYFWVRYIIWGLNFYYNHDPENFYGDWQDPIEVLPACEYKLMKITTKMSFHSVGEIVVKYWSLILAWYVKKLTLSNWSPDQSLSDETIGPERHSFFGSNNRLPINQC